MSFFDFLAQYHMLFLVVFELSLIAVLIALGHHLFKCIVQIMERRNRPEQKLRIDSHFTGDIEEIERQNALRVTFAPDGVDPAPNSYLGISDGGREYYVRSVTLSKIPKFVTYAETFEPLFNFPNCISTVFVKPEDESVTGHKIDNHINVLESEKIVSKNNSNRVRKLQGQIKDANLRAEKVERQGKRYFDVGFLFTFVADDVETLNKMTDNFRAAAVRKKMDISGCYGAQSEAYLATMPFNRQGRKRFKFMDSDCVKMHSMNQDSLSVILHYTSDHFSHKTGVPLGRNMFNLMPFIFNLFSKLHMGFTMVMAGKTRSGKSATIKMLIKRSVPIGWRYVLIDSQTKKGTSEGEFAAVTEESGGVNYKISSNGDCVLNLFDVQESIEYIKESEDSGYERRTLDLNGAISEIVYNLRIAMQAGYTKGDTELDAVMDSDINTILTDITKELFEEKGIYHGDADSLYEESSVVRDGMLMSGLVPKKKPTVTECYKKILLRRRDNTAPELEGVYRMMVNTLKEYVRELYYAEESCTFFTREQYQELAFEGMDEKKKYFMNQQGQKEYVKAFFGIRPYFDGQSTVSISRDCPVTNIDISQLTDVERRVARNVATRVVTEQFVNKNSERLDAADKMVVVVDEAHEDFGNPYARRVYVSAVRTAAKRNVGFIFSTQTVREYTRYNETADILSQASVKMIFRQEDSVEFLMETLQITESQASFIVNGLGAGADFEDDSAAGRKHKGEMCVIDGSNVQFVKVDYLQAVEKLAVENNIADIVETMRKVG